MQFPVPQFTEVEDKIIANLSLRQFGILFAGGVIVFLFFSATKSIPGTILVFILVGLPALLVAFMKVNGRPLYRTAGHLLYFFIHPREMLFHKQGIDDADLKTFESLQVIQPEVRAVTENKPALQDLEVLLQKQREQEEKLLNNPQLKL